MSPTNVPVVLPRTDLHPCELNRTEPASLQATTGTMQYPQLNTAGNTTLHQLILPTVIIDTNQHSDNKDKAAVVAEAIHALLSMKQSSIGTNEHLSETAKEHSALPSTYVTTMVAIQILHQSLQRSTTASTTTIAGPMAMMLVIPIRLKPATTANRAMLQLLTDATTKAAVCSTRTDPSGLHTHEEVGENILINL